MIKNRDEMNAELRKNISEAMQGTDPEAIAEALVNHANSVMDNLLEAAEETKGDYSALLDTQVLASRGKRAFTSKEMAYFTSVHSALVKEPQSGITIGDGVIPPSIIDAIFDDLKTEHLLIKSVLTVNMGLELSLLKSIVNGAAIWGQLTSAITAELEAEYTADTRAASQLTAFIPVSKAYLDLGPTWLGTFIITILSECIAVGVEAGVADGDGKNKPIGMSRSLVGSTDGVYARKEPIVITDLSPKTYGELLSGLTRYKVNEDQETYKQRSIDRALLVVSPYDYLTKVFPATTMLNSVGAYTGNVLPYPTDVVQAAGLPAGRAVLGIGKRYAVGLGTGDQGNIEFSDHFKFLDHQRVYKTVLYGDGQPLDNYAFALLDISGLKPTAIKVEMVTSPEADASEENSVG